MKKEMYRVTFRSKVEPGEHGRIFKPNGVSDFVEGEEIFYEDIESLGDLLYFNGIKTVIPITVIFGEPVSQAEIGQAISGKKKSVVRARTRRRIDELQKELEEARAALNELTTSEVEE